MYTSPIELPKFNHVLVHAYNRLVARAHALNLLEGALQSVDGKMLNRSIIPKLESQMPDYLIHYHEGRINVAGGPAGKKLEWSTCLSITLHEGMRKRFSYAITWERELQRAADTGMITAIENATKNLPALTDRFNAALQEMSAATEAFGRASCYIPDSYQVRKFDLEKSQG